MSNRSSRTTASADELTYSQYLHLDELLQQQVQRSDRHDEALFIVVHQTSELWLKLCLTELTEARRCIVADQVRPAFKTFARIAGIQRQLIHSWDVLSTMTPSDYLSFRDVLGTSSGFQSLQYRLVEFTLGNKSRDHVERFHTDPPAYDRMQAALVAPSLYDEALRLLKRSGLPIPDSCIERDFSKAYAPCAEVERAWAAVYQDPHGHWDLYELAEKLVDLEDRFQSWRYAHLRTVERIIGRKSGTGGTAGVPYLARVLDQRFFPEIFSARTVL